MNPLRAAIGKRLLASDPLVACARYDCRNTDPETHYDHGSGRMPNHDHQSPSVARIAIRAGYRWATGRRRLREDLAATQVKLDELRYAVKASECTQAADGLDDQDGPTLRARLYGHADYEEISAYANHGNRWWVVGWTEDGTLARWVETTAPGMSRTVELGWVEIPQDATDASEEQASE